MDYTIKINEFEGPLDLLLHLIKKSNIDIYDISIDEITKQYLDYINKMEELNINVASEYLVMASELMELKSKLLLPNQKNEEDTENEENEEEITRENLIQRLIEYQKYKEITSDFKILEQQRKQIYIKSPENLTALYNKEIINDGNTTIDDLVKAFEKFLERKEKEKPLSTKVTNKEYSVKKRKSAIKNFLKEKGKAEFTELFQEYNKSYIVVTFMSILELAKEDEININQNENFSEIYLELKVK